MDLSILKSTDGSETIFRRQDKFMSVLTLYLDTSKGTPYYDQTDAIAC